LKDSVVKAYSKKGPEVVTMNHECIDQAIDNLVKIDVPASWNTQAPPAFAEHNRAPDTLSHVRYGEGFIANIMDPVLALEGDSLPVSTFVPGGFMPAGTTQFEKRGIAPEIPVWTKDTCTQCNYCAIVCPHAVIRPFLLDREESKAAPEEFQLLKSQGGAELAGTDFTIQVSAMDCTGCAVCVESCPDDSLAMLPFKDHSEVGSSNWDYAVTLEDKGHLIDKYTVKGSQFQQPLMEFSGACSGCGETPYVKLMTQLFGDRMVVANASGCSSVWGGTATTNPYTYNKDGRGPAWGRSLFEDNAEYGLGMFVANQQRRDKLLHDVSAALDDEAVAMSSELKKALSGWVRDFTSYDKSKAAGDVVAPLLASEAGNNSSIASLHNQKDLLALPSQWMIGGDGWAYDIGYGGLDHVTARGENVNILVLDTEMYSNTGGQVSKSTPSAAVVKYATSGKTAAKKDLGAITMQYGDVYVASVAMGADYNQTVKAFKEAEDYPKTSLVLAYSPCVDWGIDMKYMMDIQKTGSDY